MGWASGAVTYFIIWWVTLFVTLPLGVRTQEEDGEVVEGTIRSAPIKPNLRKKFLLTSVLAAGIWLVVFLIVRFEMIPAPEVSIEP